MSPREYYEFVKRLEQEEFPGLFNEDGQVRGDLQDSSRHYVLFAPSHSFEPRRVNPGRDSQLMTEGIVDELKAGKTLLSVGCGEGFLEQLLVSRLGVPRERVVLADVSDAVIPMGFQRYVFDMHKPWPTIDPVDYVIFPESSLINLVFSDKPEEFEGEYIRQLSRESGLYNLLSRAAGCVRDGGEVRVNGEWTIEDVKLFVKRRLEKEDKGLTMRYTESFVCVRKGTR